MICWIRIQHAIIPFGPPKEVPYPFSLDCQAQRHISGHNLDFSGASECGLPVLS